MEFVFYNDGQPVIFSAWPLIVALPCLGFVAGWVARSLLGSMRRRIRGY